MTALRRLQQEFRGWMLEGAPELRGRVLDTAKADRDLLLAVYRDGYALRLIEALTTDYPGVLAMAGPADFDVLARAYIAARPSTDPSVRWFGRHLADFLAATPPFDGSPAAADMARFEWALGEAFDAADSTPLTFDDLAALPAEAWETLRLGFAPSLRRLTLRHEAPRAWARREAVAPGDLDVPANPPGEDGAPVAVDWLVWRATADAETQYRSMAADEAWALDAARDGADFAALCDGLAAFAPALDGHGVSEGGVGGPVETATASRPDDDRPLEDGGGGEGGSESAEDEAAGWAAQRAAGLLRVWVDSGLITGTGFDD
ncbi:MAG: putative DNA-binding domain-containing protein [Rhodospirillales bacterium]|nr:MAG: putative DNA-binding domain-containing protein [Rhodospirillales bacterium]